MLRNNNAVSCPNTACISGGLFASVRNAERVVIGAERRRDYASSERASTNVKNGSRSPEKNAIMSLTIARQLSSVR